MENPKIRFKGFTKDWEQRKLEKYLNSNMVNLIIIQIMVENIQYMELME